MLEISFQNDKKLYWIVASLILGIIFVLSGLFAVYEVAYGKKVYHGVRLNSYDVSGKTRSELSHLFSEYEQQIDDGLVFVFEDPETNEEVEVKINPVVISYDGVSDDSALISINADQAIRRALEYGRDGSLLNNIKEKITAAVAQKTIEIPYHIRREALMDVLKLNLSPYETPVINAGFFVEEQGNGDSKVSVREEKTGHEFDYELIVSQIEQHVQTLSSKPMKIVLETAQPEVSAEDIAPKIHEIENILSLAPFTVSFTTDRKEKLAWKLEKNQLVDLFDFAKTDSDILIFFHRERLQPFFSEIEQTLNIEPEDAQFSVEGGRVKVFVPERKGRAFDAEATYLAMNSALASQNNQITASVKETDAKIKLADLNSYGIEERIGVGRSSFLTSPPNRIHNIKTGTAAVNGTLVPPGAEFSMVGVLGDISAATGYLPELVIKGNKTVPEYGGGLCQVSTTVFRGAMDAGLKITERKNHAYTVRYYYENGVPGTDATIYPEHPDLRFINDTGHYILITAQMNGFDLTYEFWGKSDGRVASRTIPAILKTIPAGETQYIETTDLSPGVKKCTESSHAGMLTSFDYTVAYDDGREPLKQNFTSSYRPWRAVCLVGVAQISAPPAESSSASATPIETGDIPLTGQ